MSTPFGDVPVRPHYHQPRPDLLASLKAKVLSGAGPVAVTGRAASVGLEGMGGIGKTTLAADLCREPEVTAAFPGGIFWVTLGETPDVAQAQRRLIHWIGGTPVNPRDTAEGRDRLTTLLADHPSRCLIILDDLWEVLHTRELLPATDRHTLLITTRRGDLLRILGAEEHRVGEMTPPAARALLAACARSPEDRLPAPADAIIRECGRLPLALAIVGALLAGADAATWAEVLEALRRADHDGLDSELPDYTRSRHVFGALAVSIDRLDQEERERFADLAVFPEDTAIPPAVFDRLWFELPSLKRKRLLSLFVDRNLAPRTDNHRITLHDLQRDYLVTVCAKNDLAQRHRRLVDGYRETCGGVWAKCPDDDYGFRWLPWHLREAGETDALRGLLFDPAWMTAKMRATGVATLETDYALMPDDIEARLVGSTLRLSSHVLAEDPNQLAGQLWGHIARDQGTTIAALLDAAGNEHGTAPWLRPRRPSLTPPEGPLIRTFVGHESWINTLAVLADGCRAISGSYDNTLKLWNIETGACLATMEGHTDAVTAVVMLADGRRAISGSRDSTLKLWEIETGSCLATMEGHTDAITAVVMLADGRRAISGSSDKTLKLWDIETGACLINLWLLENSVSPVAAQADGRRVISESSDKTLKLWDIETSECLTTMQGHTDNISAVVMLADGRRAISGSRDSTLKLWEIETGACLATMEGHTDAITAVVMLADGYRAISGSNDKTLKLWNIETGACLATMEGHTDAVTALVMLADGRRAISGSWDSTLKLWDIETGACLATMEGHTDAVTAVVMLANGRRAISGSWDSTLKLWDIETGTCLAAEEGHTDAVTAVAVLADGRRAISGSWDSTLKLWDIETGTCLATMRGHRSGVTAVTVFSDGVHAISGSRDSTMKLWDIETGALITTFESHYGFVTNVAVTLDGRRALSGADDNKIKLWDIDAGTCITTWETVLRKVRAIAILADGRRAISGSTDGTLRLWDIETSTRLTTMMGHTDVVTAVVTLADGCRAISGSEDNTLKLWNIETGACLATMGEHKSRLSASFFKWSPDGISAVAMLADGRRVLSVSSNTLFKLWDPDTGIGATLFTAEAPIRCCAVAGTTVVAGDITGKLHVFDLIDAPEPTP